MPRSADMMVKSSATDRLIGFERELARVNRAMTALSQVTQTLIRAEDEAKLLDDLCRLIVEVAGYRLAWVGYARHDTERSVDPVAQWGCETSYLAQARISWADTELGRGPTGTAIRSGQAQVVRHTATEKQYSPWRDAALKHGFSSSVSLPLFLKSEVIGALNIYAAEPDAFDAGELRLIEDLAANLSYGLNMLRLQAGQREAERKLKESEQRYRSLVELSPDALLVSRDGEILFANAAADRIFRATPEAPLLGRRIAELIHPDDRDPVSKRVNSGKDAPLAEQKLFRLDGEGFYGEVTSAAITYQDQPARQAMIRDVTERKIGQAQLAQAGKLATLGEMAAGMAHELSQPIHVIRMAAESTLMFMERGKGGEDFQRKQFALIEGQAKRMAEIIDHIRIFSRKDGGATTIFDAAEAVFMAVELMERQSKNDDIAIVLDLPRQSCPVRGRPVQLEQVLVNLLANSRDAIIQKRKRFDTPVCGRITIRMAVTGQSLSIEVADNGIGVPAHLADRIFEPFFTTKEVGRGTGLGLSVSFGIINGMAGQLTMRGSDGKDGGTVFSITLPQAEGILPAPPCAPAEVAHMAGAHLLLVDDEPRAVEAMAAYLAELGFRISIAADGNAAYEIFMADPADAVITDLRMPNGGGEQLIDRLRDYDPLLPIIVVTGHLGATEQLEADRDDRMVVLKKPVGLGNLGKAVDRLLLPPPV